MVNPEDVWVKQWWANSDRNLESHWWNEGGRSQYEALAAFYYEARTTIFPTLIRKDYDSRTTLERSLNSGPASNEFERRRALDTQIENLKKLPAANWASRDLLLFTDAHLGEYQFDEGTFNASLGTANMEVFLPRPDGTPECGVNLASGFLKVALLTKNTQLRVGREMTFNTPRLKIEVPPVEAESWQGLFGKLNPAYRQFMIVSWLHPVAYYMDNNIPGTPVHLLCREGKSALYAPDLRSKGKELTQKDVENPTLLRLATWEPGDPRFAPDERAGFYFQAGHLIPLR